MKRVACLGSVMLLVSSAAACGGGGSSGTLFGSDTGIQTTATDEGIGEDDATSTAEEGEDGVDEGSEDGGVKFDTNEGETNSSEGGEGEGCEAIDFLFVIDNSGSMGDNQTNLVSSFPGFILAIQDAVGDAAEDVNVMVSRTDANWGGSCPGLCVGFGFCPAYPPFPCGQGAPTECDDVFGAGVTYPIGDDASNKDCMFTGGKRYITSVEPNLPQAFSCAAKVGTSGASDERPVGAMVAALSDSNLGQGGCNEGFVRDDAILAVIFITDEEDSSSQGTPAGWYANLVAAKGGDASAIAMVGLINDTDQPDPVCPMESQDPVRIRTLIDMFPNSQRGSVCAPDYSPVLADAVQLIKDTCDDFVPQG